VQNRNATIRCNRFRTSGRFMGFLFVIATFCYHSRRRFLQELPGQNETSDRRGKTDRCSPFRRIKPYRKSFLPDVYRTSGRFSFRTGGRFYRTGSRFCTRTKRRLSRTIGRRKGRFRLLFVVFWCNITVCMIFYRTERRFYAPPYKTSFLYKYSFSRCASRPVPTVPNVVSEAAQTVRKVVFGPYRRSF
jgi:hypothetical protein